MKIFWKSIYEMMTGELSICDNLLYDIILLAIISQLIFELVKWMVGKAYQQHLIDGRAAGSTLHWVLRILFFVVAVYLMRFFVWIKNLVLTFPLQVSIGVLCVAIGGVCLTYYVKKRG